MVDYGQLWSQVEAIGSDPDAVLEPGAPDRLFTFLDLPGLVDDVLADDFPADDLTRYYELQSIPESGEVSAWLEDLD